MINDTNAKLPEYTSRNSGSETTRYGNLIVRSNLTDDQVIEEAKRAGAWCALKQHVKLDACAMAKIENLNHTLVFTWDGRPDDGGFTSMNITGGSRNDRRQFINQFVARWRRGLPDMQQERVVLQQTEMPNRPNSST